MTAQAQNQTAGSTKGRTEGQENLKHLKRSARSRELAGKELSLLESTALPPGSGRRGGERRRRGELKSDETVSMPR